MRTERVHTGWEPGHLRAGGIPDGGWVHRHPRGPGSFREAAHSLNPVLMAPDRRATVARGRRSQRCPFGWRAWDV